VVTYVNDKLTQEIDALKKQNGAKGVNALKAPRVKHSKDSARTR
jgi:hypothetical protein